MKWDITITLDHGIEYPFDDISNPKKQVDKILVLKNRFSLSAEKKQEEAEKEWKKFDVLVEALGEVVKDYIDKWWNDSLDDESYFI